METLEQHTMRQFVDDTKKTERMANKQHNALFSPKWRKWAAILDFELEGCSGSSNFPA